MTLSLNDREKIDPCRRRYWTRAIVKRGKLDRQRKRIAEPTITRMRNDRMEAVKTGRAAVGALALGVFAIGAAAIGALAVGAVAIGRLRILEARIEKLSVGTLTVDRLNVRSRE